MMDKGHVEYKILQLHVYNKFCEPFRCTI